MEKLIVKQSDENAYAKFRKFLLIMKLTAALLIVCLYVSAKGFSQNEITLSVKQIELKSLFKLIQKKAGYRFLYEDKQLPINMLVDVDVKNQKIGSVLDQVFNNTQIQYKVINNNLVLLTTASKPVIHVFIVKGKILDEAGNPLQGVSIRIKDGKSGVYTDAKGEFSLEIPEKSLIEISFIGYKTIEREVSEGQEIHLQMEPGESSLSEVVVVGYGVKRREEVTGSISSIQSKELTVAPVANVTNALAGRLPGLVSLQSSGQPGSDAATLSIRGFGNPLVIIDGVEGNFTTLDPNTIESISVLKDASASIYGSRAGNGVILVTTKKGGSGKPVTTFNNSLSWQSVTMMPKPVSAGQFAELVRESYLNSGQPPANAPYTEEQVQRYYEGGDPQYPNTNWYDVVFRNWAPQQQHNISVRGGSDKIKYYGLIGYLDQETMLKNGGSGYKRFNIIANVDAKISDQFSFLMNFNSNYEIRKYPWRGLGSAAGQNAAWEDFWNTQPIYPATLPDPTKLSWAVGSNTGGAHIMANRDIAGYNDYNNQNFSGIGSLNYTSKFLKGFNAKALFAYNLTYGSNKNFQRPVDFYTYDYVADLYNKVGSLGSQASIALRETKGHILTGQFSVGYDKKIGNHQLSVLALHEIIDYYNTSISANRFNFLTPLIEEIFGGSTEGMRNNGSTFEMGRKSFVGRISYGYSHRYLLDINFRADASAKFPSNKRWGYFPGVTFGWRINKEQFMANVRPVDELKLRLSYGLTGNDDVGNFLYLSGYKVADNINNGMSYLIGNTPFQGLVSLGLPNPMLTWEKGKIYNAGIDFSLYERKLYGMFDVFYRERTGIPAYSITSLPSTFGAAPPMANLNSLNNRGFELKLGTSGNKRDFSWDISGNISWTRDRWMHFEEPFYTDSTAIRTQKKSGRWTDVIFGYKTDGLFASQDDIDKLPYNQDLNPTTPNASLRPGDIKYVDVNDDGLIDRKDMIELGKGTVPRWMYGIAGNFSYKQFDASLLFQGAFGYYTIINYSGGVPNEVIYNERWTEVNNNSQALIPRRGGKGFDRLSDYNYKSAAYLRLKTVAVGYSLPKSTLRRIGIEQLRLYVAATNILTFDKLKKYNIDPEAPSALAGHYYPQQKVVSVGLNLSF